MRRTRDSLSIGSSRRFRINKALGTSALVSASDFPHNEIAFSSLGREDHTGRASFNYGKGAVEIRGDIEPPIDFHVEQLQYEVFFIDLSTST